LATTLKAVHEQWKDTIFEHRMHVHVINQIKGKHRVFDEVKALYNKYPTWRFTETETRLPDTSQGKAWGGDVNVPNDHVRRQSLDLVTAIKAWTVTAKEVGAEYFLFMEDDMELCPGGLQALRYASNKARARDNFSVMRLSYGMNGLLFQARDLQEFGSYLLSRHTKRPPDHIVVEWFASETPRAKSYLQGRTNAAYRHQLFEHLGSVSSIGKGHRDTPKCYELLADLMVPVEMYQLTQCPSDDVSPCRGHKSGAKLVLGKLCGLANSIQPTAPVLAAGVAVVAAKQGVSCDATCAQLPTTTRCRQDQIPAVNTCAQLQAHLPCENGCSYHIGPEQPCYVSPDAPNQNLPMSCLVNQQPNSATCAASHPLTTRLCPCSQ